MRHDCCGCRERFPRKTQECLTSWIPRSHATQLVQHRQLSICAYGLPNFVCQGHKCSGPYTLLLLTGIQSAPRNRVGCSGDDFWDVSLGCSSFLWCGALGSLQHIRMTFCPASCLTKRATRKHRQIDPFRVQQLHPTEVSSSSTPGSGETSTSALRRPSADNDAP